jgi:hypothetical protein
MHSSKLEEEPDLLDLEEPDLEDLDEPVGLFVGDVETSSRPRSNSFLSFLRLPPAGTSDTTPGTSNSRRVFLVGALDGASVSPLELLDLLDLEPLSLLPDLPLLVLHVV